MADTLATFDADVTLRTNTFTKTGYTFAGWNTEAGGGGTPYTDEQTFKYNIDGDLRLYAQWAPISGIMVTFDKNTTDTVTGPTPANKPVTYDAVYGPLATISRVGYEFVGWFTEAVDGTEVTAATIVKNASNHTLYAKWVKSIFTVTYEPGDKGLFDPEKHEGLLHGETTPAFEGDLTNCEPGYEFAGWLPVLKETVDGDATYVAQWKTIDIYITFELGNKDMGDILIGQTKFGPPEIKYGDPMPKRPHPYAIFGYKFTGWWAVEEGVFYPAPDYTNPTNVPTFPTIVTHTETFIAQWAEVNPGIQFPDMIPSVAHFDKWWGDYGVICYAGSTTKDTLYKIVFADWFFEAYRSCTIGFGSPGKMQYEVVFTDPETEPGIRLFQFVDGVREPYKIETLDYKDGGYDVKEDGKYFTKQKKFEYGFGLTGVEFENPFGSGAKQAWLYATDSKLI
jgi:uncharacterized repeat protein (TIGR02543 family)